MKCILVLMASVVLGFGIPVAQVEADMDTIDIGVSLHDGNLEGFHLSMGEYYHVPQQEIIIIEQQQIPYYEVPVIYHISQYTHVPPPIIIDLRRRGRSWMDICTHCGCTPEIFYVPVPVEVSGPPYGHAYGHYKHKKKHEWKNIRLSDNDVVNLVNLKFISEHHHYPAEEVIKKRSSGHDFARVHHEVHQHVQMQKTSFSGGSHHKHDKTHGNGHGSGKNNHNDDKDHHQGKGNHHGNGKHKDNGKGKN